jgi:hypothetical protein
MAYKMKGFSGFKGSPAKNMKTGKYSQSFESPAKKELIGGQKNLPDGLKAKIEAAPGKMYDSPLMQKSKFDISSDKKQVPLSPGEEKSGVAITGGSKSEEINDLEDRIEFLNSDISDSDSTTEKGKMTTQRNKLQARLKKMRAK